MSPADAGTLAGALVAVFSLIAAWWRWVRPRWHSARRTATAVVETLVGREPIIDAATGRELVAPQPGLGMRMATIESALEKLADAKTTLDDHETRIGHLERSQMERLVARAESAQMFRAIANNDPDLIAEPTEPDESED